MQFLRFFYTIYYYLQFYLPKSSMTTITICGGLELIVGIIASKMTQWVIMFIAITWLESYKLTKFRILSSGRSPQQHVGKMSWFYHGWFVTTGLTRQKPISVCYLSVCVVFTGAYEWLLYYYISNENAITRAKKYDFIFKVIVF